MSHEHGNWGLGGGRQESNKHAKPRPRFTDSFRVHRPLKPMPRSFRGSDSGQVPGNRPREDRAGSRSHREQGQSPHPPEPTLQLHQETAILDAAVTVSSSLHKATVLTGWQP